MASENIFTPFEIKLFGRVLEDLQIVRPVPNPSVTEARGKGFRKASDFDDSLLEQQVKGAYDFEIDPSTNKPKDERTPRSTPTLARIYNFAYEGELYQLPKPTIFLVYGEGTSPEGAIFKNSNAGNSTTVDETGTASRHWFFEDDIKMWVYEKSAMTIRFDLATGSFEDILLEATLATMSRMAGRSGELAARSGELAARSGELASRSGEMASRSGEMAFRARHRFK